MRIEDLRASAGAIHFVAEAVGQALARVPSGGTFLRFTLAFGHQPAPGFASGAAQAGLCADASYPTASATLTCRNVIKKKAKKWKFRLRRVECFPS